MPLKGKHIKNNSISQDKLNIPLDSIIDDYDATNAEYVNNNSYNRVSIVTTSKLNNMMSANNATIGQLACDTPVIEFPISEIRVLVNNIEVTVGEGQECYFTPDGEIIRDNGNAEKGDKLVWNSSNYDLENTDNITFDYYTSNFVVDVSSGSTYELDKYNTAVNIKYTGDAGTTMTFTIDDIDFTVGNVAGDFVWDIGGSNEYTFTTETESIIQNVNGSDYTIWFDGFGSLLFSVKKGNFLPYIPFIMEVETTTANETFTLPHLSGYDYNYEVDWGDGTPIQSVSSYNDSNTTHTYESGSTYDIKINGVCDVLYFNNTGDILKVSKIKSLGNVKWKRLNFYGCSNLTSFNSGLFVNTTNITTLLYAFQSCTSLTSIDTTNWDTSNITIFQNVFYGCNNLTTINVSSWDVGNATTFRNMFYNCSSITTLNVSNWRPTQLINMYYTFYNCSTLTTLDLSNWNTPLLTTLTNTFNGCSSLLSLDLSSLKPNSCGDITRLVQSCSSMTTINVTDLVTTGTTTTILAFYYATSLTTIIGLNTWDMTNVLSMSYMFSNCSSLTSVDMSLVNVESVTNLSYIFRFCSSLTSINLSNWDMTNVTTTYYMFFGCTQLSTINGISSMPLLSEASGMFQDCASLTTLDISSISPNSTINTVRMFQGCNSLTTLDVSNLVNGGTPNLSFTFYNASDETLVINGLETWEVSGSTTFRYMFADSGVESLNLSGWTTTSLEDISYMFYVSTDLLSVDLTGWDTSNVNNTSYAFYGCNLLYSISGITNFDMTSVTTIERMFQNCTSLTTLDVSSWVLTSISLVNQAFYNCNVITNAAPDWWNTLTPINYTQCFYNNTSRSNYASIPAAWK